MSAISGNSSYMNEVRYNNNVQFQQNIEQTNRALKGEEAQPQQGTKGYSGKDTVAKGAGQASAAQATYTDLNVAGPVGGHQFSAGLQERFSGLGREFGAAIANNDMAAAQQICHSSNFESVMQEAAGCIGAINGNSMDADINAIIQQVLRESYMDTNQDLKYYAAKVKSFNEQKKVARNALQEMRKEKTSQMDEMRKANPELKFEEFNLTKDQIEDMKYEYVAKTDGNGNEIKGPDGKPVMERKVATDAEGNPILGADGKPVYELSEFGKLCQDYQLKMDDITTGQKLDDAIQTMEETLSSIGDDAQLANTDLQNVMQKQQQYIQMMSNVSKMVHDTAMAIIRKIG